jgi:DNA-binding IclR family transcriptional regulator
VLSTLDPAEVSDIVHHLAGRYGRYKVPTNTILKQIAVARSKGYCLMEVGLVPGTKAISIPILQGAAAEAAITLSGVSRRVSPSREPEIVERLQKVASAIEVQLKRRIAPFGK